MFWYHIVIGGELTRPAVSMAFLSSFAKPVNILAWNTPDSPMSGKKHMITKDNFQLKYKAMMKEAPMLVNELTIMPI